VKLSYTAFSNILVHCTALGDAQGLTSIANLTVVPPAVIVMSPL